MQHPRIYGFALPAAPLRMSFAYLSFDGSLINLIGRLLPVVGHKKHETEAGDVSTLGRVLIEIGNHLHIVIGVLRAGFRVTLAG